jgi:hypothetical protein
MVFTPLVQKRYPELAKPSPVLTDSFSLPTFALKEKDKETKENAVIMS